jgi:hypothetical protein
MSMLIVTTRQAASCKQKNIITARGKKMSVIQTTNSVAFSPQVNYTD